MGLRPARVIGVIDDNRLYEALQEEPQWRRAIGHMYSDLFYSFTISFLGAILFLLVDKYEPEGAWAGLLKFLVLFVAGVAVLHRLQPYGLALF